MGRPPPLFALVLLALALGCSDSGPAFPKVDADPSRKPVEVVSARSLSAVSAGAYSGVTQAPEQIGLGFRVGGTLAALDVDIGDRVGRGERLGRLDPARYRMALERAQAELRGARATAARAETELARTEELRDAEAATERQLERAVREAATAKSRVSALRQRARRARLELSWTRLDAPAAGYIAERLADPGETLAAGEPAVTLAAGDALEVEVQVPGETVAALELGQTIEIHLPGRDAPRSAVVTEIGQSTPGEATLFPVIARLDGDLQGLRPGMSVTARLGGSEARTEGPVVVPPEAIAADREGAMAVFIVTSTAAEVNGPSPTTVVRRVEVEVQRVGPSGAIVRAEGLAPGDRVVAAGADGLEDGARVRPSDTLVRVPGLTPALSAEEAR